MASEFRRRKNRTYIRSVKFRLPGQDPTPPTLRIALPAPHHYFLTLDDTLPNFGHIRIQSRTDDRPHQRLIVGVHIGPAVQDLTGVKKIATMEMLSQLAFHADEQAQRRLRQEVLPAEAALVRGHLVVDDDVGQHEVVRAAAAGYLSLTLVYQPLLA